MKLKECEKKDKYLDLGRELKKLWNMKVTIIPIVIGAFGTVTKGLQKDWRTWKLADEWRPSKQQHYWERPEYWEESWRLEETWCHSNFSERPSADTDVKNSNGDSNNNNDNQQKKRELVDFAVPADHRIKLKECEKRYKYMNLVRKLKKLWNMKVTIIPIVIGAFGTVTKVLIKGQEDLEKKRTSGDHSNYYIIENSQNTEKSPEDLRRLAVTQISMKDQLTLMGKTLKE